MSEPQFVGVSYNEGRIVPPPVGTQPGDLLCVMGSNWVWQLDLQAVPGWKRLGTEQGYAYPYGWGWYWWGMHATYVRVATGDDSDTFDLTGLDWNWVQWDYNYLPHSMAAYRTPSHLRLPTISTGDWPQTSFPYNFWWGDYYRWKLPQVTLATPRFLIMGVTNTFWGGYGTPYPSAPWTMDSDSSSVHPFGSSWRHLWYHTSVPVSGDIVPSLGSPAKAAYFWGQAFDVNPGGNPPFML